METGKSEVWDQPWLQEAEWGGQVGEWMKSSWRLHCTSWPCQRLGGQKGCTVPHCHPQQIVKFPWSSRKLDSGQTRLCRTLKRILGLASLWSTVGNFINKGLISKIGRKRGAQRKQETKCGSGFSRKSHSPLFSTAAFGRGLKPLSYDWVVPGGRHLTVLYLVRPTLAHRLLGGRAHLL